MESGLTYLVNCLWVDGVVRPWDLGYAFYDAVDGRVPSVVVLWRESCDNNAATVKLVGQVVVAQKIC